MKVFKEKGILRFEDQERGVATYDLRNGNIHRFRNGKFIPGKSLALFFSGLYIDDVFKDFEDDKFAKFLKKVSYSESTCRSIDSFLKRMTKYWRGEAYVKVGIDVSFSPVPETPVNKIPKDIVKIYSFICSEFGTRLHWYTIDSPTIGKKGGKDCLHYKMLRYAYSRENFNFLKKYASEADNRIINFEHLVNDYNYDYKALVDYMEYLLTMEGFDLKDACNTLMDYIDMHSVMARNRGALEKYPKYLQSKHDIANVHYQLFKEEYDEELFKSRYNVDLLYRDSKYSIIMPEESNDIKREGIDLSHCVKSYIKKIVKGNCLIVFMRINKEISESLLTVEIIGDKINQVKGKMNRNPDEEELVFLRKYAKKMELKFDK